MTVQAQPENPQIPVIKTLLQAFIDTIKNRDRAFMASCLLPTYSATLIRTGTIYHLDKATFLDRLPWDEKAELEEVLTEIDIQVYDDIAVAWTPFYTTKDGVIETKGTNIITLMKVDASGEKAAGAGEGVWKISGVCDTSVRV